MDKKFEARKDYMELMLTVVIHKWEEDPATWKEWVVDPELMDTFLKSEFKLELGQTKIKSHWGYLYIYIGKEETWNIVFPWFRADFLLSIDFKDFQHMLYEHHHYQTRSAIFKHRILPPELLITPAVSIETASLETNSTSNPDEVIAELYRQIFKEKEKSTALQKELDEAQDELENVKLRVENERLKKEIQKYQNKS